jgi:hypothetical protein
VVKNALWKALKDGKIKKIFSFSVCQGLFGKDLHDIYIYNLLKLKNLMKLENSLLRGLWMVVEKQFHLTRQSGVSRLLPTF